MWNILVQLGFYIRKKGREKTNQRLQCDLVVQVIINDVLSVYIDTEMCNWGPGFVQDPLSSGTFFAAAINRFKKQEAKGLNYIYWYNLSPLECTSIHLCVCMTAVWDQ